MIFTKEDNLLLAELEKYIFVAVTVFDTST